MHWCRHNCTGEWNISDFANESHALKHEQNWGLVGISHTNMYSFEFSDEKDFILFNLKFK
jgi:hypothetical protein